MNTEHEIRKLARSRYWQELYRSAKHNSGIHLFDNINNFSSPQTNMLYWLKIYDLLYTELAQLEWENLDDMVISNDNRCDAFLYWRAKQIEKQLRENKKEMRKGRKKRGSLKVFSGAKAKKEVNT